MPSLITPNTKILSLPAYTTILSQAFSPNGDYLAVGSERGRIAIFQISDLVSVGRDNLESSSEKLTCLFYFDVGSEESSSSGVESVNTLATTKTFLVAAVSATNNCARILAWSWKDLIKSAGLRGALARPSVAWTIDSRSLPSDVNSTIVDEKSDVSASGRLFVAGGTSGPTNSLDHAIRVLDLETRSECVAPLKGHEGYIHDISLDQKSNLLASASEDGTVKLWDLRVPKGKAQEFHPSKSTNLSRPQLGKWVGAVSLSGEFIGCGGGPKPALFHLRTLSPIDSDGLQLPASSESIGSVHVVDIYGDDNRVIVGGEFQGKLYQTNLNGELMADIETSSSCVYSVAHWCHDPLKILSFAGSSSKIDLCTANFSYRDRTITFPAIV